MLRIVVTKENCSQPLASDLWSCKLREAEGGESSCLVVAWESLQKTHAQKMFRVWERVVTSLRQPCEQRLPGSQNKFFRKMNWERQTLEWQASDNRNYLDLESVRPHCSRGKKRREGERWVLRANFKETWFFFKENLNSKYTLWHQSLLVL